MMNLTTRYGYPDNYLKFSKGLRTALNIKFNEREFFYGTLSQLEVAPSPTTLTREVLEARGHEGEYKKEHLHGLLFAYMKERKQVFSLVEYELLRKLLIEAGKAADKSNNEKQSTVFWTRFVLITQLLIDHAFNSISIDDDELKPFKIEYSTFLEEVVSVYDHKPIIMDEFLLPSETSLYNSFETFIEINTNLHGNSYISNGVYVYFDITTQYWTSDNDLSGDNDLTDSSLSFVQSCVDLSANNTIIDLPIQDSAYKRVSSRIKSDSSLSSVESCVGSSELTRTRSNVNIRLLNIHGEEYTTSGGRRTSNSADTSWSIQILVLYILIFVMINVSLLMLVLWTRFRLFPSSTQNIFLSNHQNLDIQLNN